VTRLPRTVSGGALTANWRSDEPGVTFRCVLDGVALGTCEPPFSPRLDEGEHVLHVQAVDGSNNAGGLTEIRLVAVDPTPATRTWIVDTRPPQTAVQAAPAAVTPEAGTPATVTLTVPAPAAFDVFYSYAGGRLTRLVVTGATAPQVTVKRPRKRAARTTVARLVGKRLPKGTKITVRQGDRSRTITLR